jgi:hypothetical protein
VESDSEGSAEPSPALEQEPVAALQKEPMVAPVGNKTVCELSDQLHSLHGEYPRDS